MHWLASFVDATLSSRRDFDCAARRSYSSSLWTPFSRTAQQQHNCHRTPELSVGSPAGDAQRVAASQEETSTRMPPPTTNASSSATGQPTPATPAKAASVTAPATSTKMASASPANAAGATGSGAAGASAPANKRSASVSSTSTAAATPESTSGKKDSKRRKVNLACVYCRRSHMTCDDSRPCKRW